MFPIPFLDVEFLHKRIDLAPFFQYHLSVPLSLQILRLLYIVLLHVSRLE